MTNRITSLSVTTEGAEEWFRLFQDLSELASNLGAVHRHVSVTSTVIEEDDGSLGDPEGLYYDEYTGLKARQAIVDAVIRKTKVVIPSSEVLDDLAIEIITELREVGILLRERPR